MKGCQPRKSSNQLAERREQGDYLKKLFFYSSISKGKISAISERINIYEHLVCNRCKNLVFTSHVTLKKKSSFFIRLKSKGKISVISEKRINICEHSVLLPRFSISTSMVVFPGPGRLDVVM